MGLRRFSFFVCICTPVSLAGCGSKASTQQQCVGSWPLTVTPMSATLDHTAAGAQNLVVFRGVARATLPAGCPQTTDLEALVYASWSNPDPTDIQISSADDSTNGQASCLHATSAAVTLTGTFSNYTAPDGTVVGTPADLTYVVGVSLACK